MTRKNLPGVAAVALAAGMFAGAWFIYGGDRNVKTAEIRQSEPPPVTVAASVKILPRPLPGSLEAPDLWEDYKRRFISAEGRVIDTANGGISHSESQGYGMLLAVAALDRPMFDLIWGWTAANLDVREDGLAAWRWEPVAPHVRDSNNATDGDLLIAWALAEAGRHWNDETLRAAAVARTRALRNLAFRDGSGRPMLLPGAAGFSEGDRADGPVVNPSYWVFPAFPVLAALDSGSGDVLDWTGLEESGLALLAESRFSRYDLPAEWVALGGSRPSLADGFSPLFGYNAVRIPLYLAWAGPRERRQLAPFAAAWSGRVPTVVDLVTGEAGHPMSERGYRAIADLVSCAMDGIPMPKDVLRPSDEHYYPATLRALALIAVKQRYPECW